MASDPDGWADDVYLVWSDLGECRHIVTGDVSPCESVGMEESTSSYWSCE